MSDNDKELASILMLGRIAIRAKIRAVTGLFIGGNEPATEIGGVDHVVIRDPVTREPYVPGSSLKGKMRSLTERALGLKLREVQRTGDSRNQRFLHLCGQAEDYEGMDILKGYRGCPVCNLYGNIPRSFPVLPTRLLTRDAFLSGESRDTLFKKSTELPFTEVKTETLVDRISSASTPRYRERIPAGTVFDASWSFSCYSTGGEDRKDHLLLALFFAGWSLLEGDYLGGQGTRGYGGVSFEEVHVDVAHNRSLSKDATDFVEQLKESRTTEELLSTTGNPLSSMS